MPDAETTAAALRVGLEAPALLTAAFLRATDGWGIRASVLNISSGAGRRAIAGWSVYCAAKAGLDQLSRVMAEDEARRPNGAKDRLAGPGGDRHRHAVATACGRRRRLSRPAALQGTEGGGQLASAEDAAARVLAYLARPDFGANPVADVRDA
jgi:benzil reductase ((S)-benzoin forming)